MLFGAATPFASRLVGSASPLVLAGLLYLGSGAALGLSLAIRRSSVHASISRGDVPPLVGATVFGGGLAPVLLLIGLEHTSAASASMLLNLEVVFTALLAWLVFRDGFSVRVGAGLLLVVVGAVLVSWQPGRVEGIWGAVAIAGACGCWALDNNLTHLVSAKDPRQIAAVKGAVAGGANLAIGLLADGSLPSITRSVSAMAIGIAGYGVSLMLFVAALRELGAARTGGLFATAPFVGVAISVLMFGDRFRGVFVPAGAAMIIGVWLQVTERHVHAHHHERLVHTHLHVHDDGHHDHEHEPGVDPRGPHSHLHQHQAAVHSHEHRPDIHHRHGHATAGT